MEPRWPCVCGLWLVAGYNQSLVPCLVPRPRFSSRPKRFGSRGLCENASDTSTKRIDREGLGKRRTGTRQVSTQTTTNVGGIRP